MASLIAPEMGEFTDAPCGTFVTSSVDGTSRPQESTS
jgi:hypothetical protein